MSIRQKKLPIAALERIDDLCSDFEKQCQAGESPSIEAALAQLSSADQKDVLLAELIALDVDYRRRAGHPILPEEYQQRFPQHTDAVKEALKESMKGGKSFAPPTVAKLAGLFPNLEIMELIGAGGMGAVYKARQSGLDRVVALKILPEEFGNDVKFALRFTREARTLAKLNHPNIVSVFEFGKAEDTYYFLMEFVEGSTLRDIVQAGELAPEHALKIVPHLCDALQYAHDQGIVHRDIKPENILIAVDGTVKVADFGLSRILNSQHADHSLTATHQVMGTPRYMAPEHLEGSKNVDHRADIYSLGVVFYEMLTGELPMGRFAAPSQKVHIDVRLDEVVLRTLEKEPQRRYQRASQIKSDVELITSSASAHLQETNLQNTAAYQSSSLPDIVSATTGSSPIESNVAAAQSNPSVAEQDAAGRLILTRRQLMDQVQRSLRPLFQGQMLQVVCGVALIVVGALCWAPNTHVTHLLVNGLILHVYGVLVISQSLLVYTRMRRIDYAKPIAEIRNQLDSLRSGYLRAGVIIGFIWWLMWIPACVALGLDMVLLPTALWISLISGGLGFAVSVWFFWRAIRPQNPNSELWRTRLAGRSIAGAYKALDEIEQANIR